MIAPPFPVVQAFRLNYTAACPVTVADSNYPPPGVSDDLEVDNASSRELQDPGSAVQNAVRCARSRSRILDPLSEIGSTASIQGPRSAPPKGPKSRVTRGGDPESWIRLRAHGVGCKSHHPRS
eukprot:scaffold23235_cov63-Phaeocystis_antarctica.AAC.1